MIRREELMRIARMTGMKPHQQEKHYVQAHLLRSLYSRYNPAFKGGTALMFADGLNRFSEDLDFTTTGDASLARLSGTVTDDLEYVGIRARKKDVEGSGASISFKISAEGPLFTKEIERCSVRVEVSLREEVVLPPRSLFLETEYPDMLPFRLSVMDLREIAAEKVRALMTRDKARDVLDLGFICRKGAVPEAGLIDEKLKYYKMKFNTDRLEEELERKRGIWRSELAPVVFGSLPDFDKVKEVILSHLSS
jgi:predicted nucleotidyltransferase component of viral defense system